MKKLAAPLSTLGLFFLLIFASQFHGCGAGSPPASIPAPVGSMVSAVGPDASGIVTISGSAGTPGAAQPGAMVIATNPPVGGPLGRSWHDFFLKSAYAQLPFQCPIGTTCVSTFADSQGGFTLAIPANTGDQIGLQQELNGEFSDETVITVPCNPCSF